MLEQPLSYDIIGAFFKVHRTLGFGFMEHVYSAALDLELRKRGHRMTREFGVPVYYEGVEIARQRLDLVVDERIVLEIKATERLHRDATRQLYNYLRATNLEVGLLLHFGRSGDFYRVICSNPSRNSLHSPDS